MFNKLNIQLLLVFALIIAFSLRASHAIDMKGISYTSWEPNSMSSSESDESLAIAASIGCNWVAICVWWFQDNINSTVIEPDYTRYSATPESVVHGIQRSHELGMKVMLKPMLDCRDGNWRGYINPSVDWFEAYDAFVTLWAEIAVLLAGPLAQVIKLDIESSPAGQLEKFFQVISVVSVRWVRAFI